MNYIKEILYLIPELYKHRYNLTGDIQQYNCSLNEEIIFAYKYKPFISITWNYAAIKTKIEDTESALYISIERDSNSVYVNDVQVDDKTEDELFLLRLTEPLVYFMDAVVYLRNKTTFMYNYIKIQSNISTELYEAIKEQIST